MAGKVKTWVWVVVAVVVLGILGIIAMAGVWHLLLLTPHQDQDRDAGDRLA